MSSFVSLLAIIFYSLSITFCSILAGDKYEVGDSVAVYVNKVGPYFNPHETYHYYSLPVCRPDKIQHKSLSLGEVLDGDRMAMSQYQLQFAQNSEKKVLCNLSLSKRDVEILQHAIEDLYYFEFVIDDIPVRGFVGHLEETAVFPHVHKVGLWSHLTFTALYNGNRIIHINVTTATKNPVALDDVQNFPLSIPFTYSGILKRKNTFHWVKTELAYEDRDRLIHAVRFFPKTLEIHWLSIINSMVLVFLLLGFVAVILTRILKHDFARYNVDNEEVEEMEQEENGWKIIHSDVFRFPPHKSLFCALLGGGCQFLCIFTGIMIMAIMGLFNVHQHGTINSAALVLYAFTSCVSGYVAANLYKQLGGTAWVWNINLTAIIFAFPFLLVWSIVNTIAWAQAATQALPFGTVILISALWLLVGYPLTILGGIFGKNWAHGFDPPCRTKNIAREIPDVPWYRSPIVHCLIGGFLPFSAISVELYYVFATLWGREMYTLYGILFIVYIIALSVTACIAVTLTYFQLSSEDYRWWWRSFLSGGMSGAFVFIYAIFYFVKRSNMSGLLQTIQFFGYTLLTCYIFFLVLGTLSFFASLKFVRYIYANVKMD